MSPGATAYVATDGVVRRLVALHQERGPAVVLAEEGAVVPGPLDPEVLRVHVVDGRGQQPPVAGVRLGDPAVQRGHVLGQVERPEAEGADAGEEAPEGGQCSGHGIRFRGGRTCLAKAYLT